MASPARRYDGTAKPRGGRSDLINFDHRNEANPLKQEVTVRKTGGLFLSPNGVKVEIPPGASTGRRERLFCSSVSSTARGVLGPWLGPNLRMASDMQIFYAPTNFRQPVAVFIPFSFAATRELSYPLPEEPADRSRNTMSAMGEESMDVDPMQAGERPQLRLVKSGPRSKSESPIRTSLKQQQQQQQLNRNPPLIDTRSIFLLTCRLGEDRWSTSDKFTVIQPTIHHTHWPVELKRLVTQSSRWPDTSYAEVNQTTDPTMNSKRFSANTSRNRRTTAHQVRENDPLEIIRRIDNYCGGICVAAEELCHCFLIVVGTRAENFHINRDGGLFRSPLLHPFLSVRIPKRSCLVNRVASFKAIDIRSNWAQGAVQFDPQLFEIEGCSDIYELELPDITFRRPATVRLPLPQWFINHRRARSHENWDQNSTTVASSEVPEVSANSRLAASDGTFTYDRPLMILYQPPGYKRQIVWQVANPDDTREEINRRKSRIQVARKDNMNTPRCKIDNVFCRLGWSYLTVGVRGGPWQIVKQPVYYTQRTVFFQTNVLGRFVLIGARDPERTTASKLAHLMTRVEALASSPPGALLICLHLQPNCWKIMANVYPEERLADVIQEQVAAGYIPLIQMTAGLVRKLNGLSNAVLQAIEMHQQNKEGMDIGKSRTPYPYRVHGGDINHVLLFNGLCLEFRLTGDVSIKPVSQCDTIVSVLKNKDSGTPKPNEWIYNADSVTDIGADTSRSPSVNLFGNSLFGNEPKQDTATLLTKHARMQHHELLHETACVVEIEPNVAEEGKYIKRCLEKSHLVTELLKISARKQDNGQTDEEEDEDEDDESDEHPGRRSSTNGTHSQSSYDGDEREYDEATKEAQAQALRDQPLSLATVNAELLRRLNNVSEKNKVVHAADLINKVHSLLHVGTVEVWLISPENLPKLNVASGQKDESRAGVGAAPMTSFSDAQPGSTPQVAPSVTKDSEAEPQVEPEVDANQPSSEGHNAIRWNPAENMNPGEPSRPLMSPTQPESGSSPRKPLAAYNILIDPDLVVGYLRIPQGKGGAAGSTQKKGSKGKHQTAPARSRSQKKQQRNVSATAKLRVRQARSLSNEIQLDITDSEQPPDSFDIALPEELRLLNNMYLRTLSLQIQEPQKLAEALGLPVDEYARIARVMEIDRDISMNQCAYEVLKAWKNCYASNRIRLNASVCGSARDGDTTTNTEQTYRSPLSDLIDVFQSLGCFEAAEMITRLKNDTRQRPQF